jgi:hypothetical protein
MMQMRVLWEDDVVQWNAGRAEVLGEDRGDEDKDEDREDEVFELAMRYREAGTFETCFMGHLSSITNAILNQINFLSQPEVGSAS